MDTRMNHAKLEVRVEHGSWIVEALKGKIEG